MLRCVTTTTDLLHISVTSVYFLSCTDNTGGGKPQNETRFLNKKEKTSEGPFVRRGIKVQRT